ncbi:DNA cytosine methyltransferase [Nocardioidaceae bacterium]|nr:DNA cytosine methyltransferase [Nocardioidaceae bacterium]
MQRVHGLSPIRVIDLFAGAGGLSQGFTQSSERYQVAAAVELDKAAAATWAANHGHQIFWGSVDEWLDSDSVPSADVVVGGPPCQGFSMIGRRDPCDQRNSLWRSLIDTVLASGAKAFVIENVPAFLKSPQFEALLNEVLQGMLAGFRLSHAVLNAADFGVAQTRKRAFVVGVRRDLADVAIPRPTGQIRATVRDAIGDVRPFAARRGLPSGRVRFEDEWLPGPFTTPNLHIGRDYSPLSRARFRAVPYGGSRLDLPDHLSMDCWRQHPRSATDSLGRLTWEKPAGTVRTEFFKPEKGRFLHPTQDRAMTHFEAARFQGFPDDYRFVGDLADIARQIGNAVPPPLARAVADCLLPVFGQVRTPIGGSE